MRDIAMRRVKDYLEELQEEYPRRFDWRLSADNAARLLAEYRGFQRDQNEVSCCGAPGCTDHPGQAIAQALENPQLKEVVFTAGANGAGETTPAITAK